MPIARRADQINHVIKEKLVPAKLLCPSAPADVNAILLGVVQLDGSVAFIKQRLAVTRDFLAVADQGKEAETRFRFSSPCVGSACKQWAGEGCSVPKRLAGVVPRAEAINALPDCSIRAQCRWFEQEGADACRICPMVVRGG